MKYISDNFEKSETSYKSNSELKKRKYFFDSFESYLREEKT